ncbi:uncharacterized protein A4U43_C03F19170 [Asparagus officinalis]|uniref:Sulfotransferase n=1 Tax=Asparagus officinalis TaxID=4686 RepID=A0A5P1FBA8_ASPOF|nr:uncharacterized protein LOC109834021 [Asparagus officinalis]ONK75656.1 uncharacterized protein A4U43_C03F19170 [Asparagus officinalis]
MKAKDEKLGEGCCFFNKDTLVLKLPKKSPILSRMVVLAVVMICSVYICSICLKQTKIHKESNFMRIKLIEKPYHAHRIPHAQIPYVHYPEPITYSRNECACAPVRFFTIVSMQRSGSGWFETLLNSHINVSSHGEIFANKERRSNMSAIMRTLDKVYNLDWNSSASKNECTAAVGFKWMLNQGLMQHYGEIAEYFNKRGVSVIFLFRRNQLRQWISLLANSHDQYAKQLNGTHKAHVHSQYEANILARFKPMIDAKMLVPKLKQLHDWVVDALEQLKSNRHMVIYYEDLIRNDTKVKDVMDFLKVPQRRLISHHVKIHTKPLSHLVENWDDVHNALAGTQYESFLTSDYQM